MDNESKAYMGPVMPEVSEDLSNRYLTFYVSGQVFGLSIRDVIEIVQIQEITPLPELPYHIKGFINMRGQVISIIDINLRFGKPEQPYTGRTCIIMLDIRGTAVGFVVDGVAEVLDIMPGQISRPPATAGSDQKFVTGIGKCGEKGEKIVLILDSRRLVSDEEIGAFGSFSV